MKSRQYTKIIKYLYYTLFFFVPFVVYPATSELFEFNKMLFIYALSVFIGAVWLMRCIQERRFIFRRSTFDIPIGIFLLSQIASTIFSIDVHTSLFGYYGRFNGGLISLSLYIFLYYAFVSNVADELPKAIRSLFVVSLISSTLIILWGLPGKMGHDLSCLLFTGKFDNTCWTAQFRPEDRMFSMLGQPNWLGAYLAITFFMGIYLFITSSSKKNWMYGAYIILAYVGILFTRSRSALGSIFPGFVLIVLSYFFVMFRKSKEQAVGQFKKIILMIVGITIATFIFKTGIAQVDSILELHFLSRSPVVSSSPQIVPIATPSAVVTGGITESFDIRKIVWKGAIQLGEEYPLFGTGVETFGYSYYSVRPKEHNATSEWDYLYNKAHNEYLNFFATTGWFGLGSVLLFIAWLYVFAIKQMFANRKNEERMFYYLSIASIALSIIVTNFFGFSITIINLYWYLLPAFLISLPSSNNPERIKERSLPWWGYLVPFAISLYLISSIASYWMADLKYAASDMALKSNNIEASVSLLREAIALRGEHTYEDKLSYALAQLAFYSAYQKQTENAQKYMQEAEELNLASIRESTQNILYWKTRVKNEYLFYQMTLDKKFLFTGLSALEEATKLGPTDPKIPYFTATYQALLFDEEKNAQQKAQYRQKAFDAIDKAIALKNDYGDAYYLKVELLKKFGDKKAAKQLLEWYIPRFAPENQTLQKELQEI